MINEELNIIKPNWEIENNLNAFKNKVNWKIIQNPNLTKENYSI